MDLDATASVRLIPAGLQLARVPKHVLGAPVHDLVPQAASHALVLQHLSMPNGNRWGMPTNTPTFYPLKQIDALLDSIRMTVAVPTGYAQIFIRPLGWAHRYVADLPPVIEGATLRRYPPSFDDGGWSQPPSRTITSRELETVGEVHGRLTDAPDKLKLAARRLSSASLRAEEHDAIIDLCIGLEAALGDESKSDITFKLALRVAAVMVAAGTREPPAFCSMRHEKCMTTVRGSFTETIQTERVWSEIAPARRSVLSRAPNTCCAPVWRRSSPSHAGRTRLTATSWSGRWT